MMIFSKKQCLITSLMCIISSNTHSSQLDKKFNIKMFEGLDHHFQFQLEQFNQHYVNSISLLDNNFVLQSLPFENHFFCGTVMLKPYELPEKTYVFENPIKIETWIPIEGETTKKTYWQVTTPN